MISTTQDAFITSYIESNPCWMVTLSSGLVVFQDDNRPHVEPCSAWVRLYNYCNNSKDYITDMTIRFRSNTHTIPSNADGYYFCKGARGGLSLSRTIQLFFVGTLLNNQLLITCWKVPEMMREVTEERDPDKAGICLIKKPLDIHQI